MLQYKIMTGKKLIILLGAVALLIVVGFIISGRIKKPLNLLNPSPLQTWEITLSYNSQNQTLSLKKITVLEKQIRPDYRVAADSPYQLQVLDKSGKVLYLTKIHITENLTHSIWTGYPVATPAATQTTPTSFETTVFVPYFSNASKIQIERDGKVVLTIDVKEKKLGLLNLIPLSFAQSSISSGGPLKVVIIGDGFTSLSQFQSQAQTMINALQGAPPYSAANPSIFEFIIANNTYGFACAPTIPFGDGPPQGGPFQGACTEDNIKRIGFGISPQAAKFIVLVNGSSNFSIDVTNDIGGDISLININQPPGILFTKETIHEFLGHAVGELYDRYALTSKPGIKRGIKSNCSDNPGGEAFWRQAGSTGPYPQPCDSPNLYAPFPNDCPPPPQPPPGYSGPVMTSRGSSGTIMGACNPNAGFDSVEQAWIRTQIMPRYQAATAPTPIPIPTSVPVIPTTLPQATPIPQATTTPQAVNDCSFNLISDQIVRGDVLTQVSAVKANSSYYLSLVVLNSAIGSFVGGVTQSNSLVASWNSLKLYQNGSATLRCLITDTAFGGNTIFSKDVTINVQN